METPDETPVDPVDEHDAALPEPDDASDIVEGICLDPADPANS